jgi:hypothetical protein
MFYYYYNLLISFIIIFLLLLYFYYYYFFIIIIIIFYNFPLFYPSIHLQVSILNEYLKCIFGYHELVASDEMLLFLDEEASSMQVDISTLEPLTVRIYLSIYLYMHLTTHSNPIYQYLSMHLCCYASTGT